MFDELSKMDIPPLVRKAVQPRGEKRTLELTENESQAESMAGASESRAGKRRKRSGPAEANVERGDPRGDGPINQLHHQTPTRPSLPPPPHYPPTPSTVSFNSYPTTPYQQPFRNDPWATYTSRYEPVTPQATSSRQHQSSVPYSTGPTPQMTPRTSHTPYQQPSNDPWATYGSRYASVTTPQATSFRQHQFSGPYPTPQMTPRYSQMATAAPAQTFGFIQVNPNGPQTTHPPG